MDLYPDRWIIFNRTNGSISPYSWIFLAAVYKEKREQENKEQGTRKEEIVVLL